MFNIEFYPIAEEEMSDAFDWYEGQSNGLGDRFYKELSHYLTLLETAPYHFQIKYPHDIRAATLKKFPYLIIYVIDEEQGSVVILSVFHTSRRPKHF